MKISDTSIDGAMPSLLALWKAKLLERLTQTALDAIRPAAMEEAEKVLKEMEPILKAHYEPHLQLALVELGVKPVARIYPKEQAIE